MIDEEDDDDDGINVIIDNLTLEEDVHILNEVRELIEKSITLNPCERVITVSFNNKLIMVHPSTAISSKLASRFWAPPKVYQQQDLSCLELFNKHVANLVKEGMILRNTYPGGIDKNIPVALFSVQYQQPFGVRVRKRVYETYQIAKDSGTTICNYHYIGFCVLIIQNGSIIDFAVHGKLSNIEEAIRRHCVTKVYYNSQRSGPLDVFMRFKHQPFYAATYDKLHPLIINKFNENFNPGCMCPVTSSFRCPFLCPFCIGLTQLRSFLFHVETRHVRSDDIPYYKKRKPHVRTKTPYYNSTRHRY